MNKSETEEQIKVRQPLAEYIYEGEPLDEYYEQIIADEVNVKMVRAGEKAYLDKHLTEELLEEGFIRELIRFVQAARKKAGLEVDDRIKLSIDTEISEDWQDVLKAEVLAVELGQDNNYQYDEVVKVNGKNITISLEKA